MHYLFLLIIFIPALLSAQVNVNFKAEERESCDTLTVTFQNLSNGSGISYYTWDYGDGSPIDTAESPTHTYIISGEFDVQCKAFTYAGEEFERTKQEYIKIHVSPEADFNVYDTIYYTSFSVKFESNPNLDSLYHNYYWDFGDGSENDTAGAVIHTFPGESNYIVKMIVEDKNLCRDSIEKSVEIKDLFEVPNIFTPNGDGYNDVFHIQTNGTITYSLTILNRNGSTMYSQIAKNLYWDGRTSFGIEAATGVYFYIIKAEEEGMSFEKKGSFHLMK